MKQNRTKHAAQCTCITSPGQRCCYVLLYSCSFIVQVYCAVNHAELLTTYTYEGHESDVENNADYSRKLCNCNIIQL